MKFTARLRSFFKALTRRPLLRGGMEAELGFHIESRAEDLVRNGLAPPMPCAGVRMEFGGIEGHKQDMRASLGLRWPDELLADLRFAFRMMAKNRGFTVAAVLTLAIGIGANTAIFTVVNATLIRPLGYPNADRLAMVWESHQSGVGQAKCNVARHFPELAGAQHGLRADVGHLQRLICSVRRSSPEQIPVQLVSPNFFSVLGTNAVMGRVFNPAQEKSGSDDVALLSFDLWQRRFGANPDIVGAKITVDNEPLTVIGVLPQGFRVLHQGKFIWSAQAGTVDPDDLRQ